MHRERPHLGIKGLNMNEGIAARVQVTIMRLRHGFEMDLPAYATPGSAGMDLLAALDNTLSLPPSKRTLVPTGIAIALPPGFEAQIRPRSGLAIKHGVTCLNSPGTIDTDYRGEIGVILINHGEYTFEIKRGMRIAQVVISPITRAEWVERNSLNITKRGLGSFGSTGVD